MSSMQVYLAQKYMSGPKADAILSRVSDATTKKKKKRKGESSGGAASSFIKDEEDDLRWGAPIDAAGDGTEDAVVEKDRSFKKRKVEAASDGGGGGGGWITVQGGGAGGEEVEEVPVEEVRSAPMQGGLVMPSEFQSTLPQASLSKKSKKGKERAREREEQAQETVYRDASGRRIEVETPEEIAAKAAAAEREKARVEAQKKEWNKGLVQRDAADARRREEENLRSKGVARYADDAELNDAQKAIDRWNDPAAAFLTKTVKKGPKKPLYNGPPPPPNRFGIRPGYRWDGVDRSNGFEKKYFQAINERGRTKAEAYQWSVDDM